MKIAVYTIALNEEQFVQRWYESAKDADHLLIADTGSTDKTKAVAEALGITVIPIEIKPWRFDKARNAALDLIPADIDFCIALDMDEILQPNWREHLETVKPTVTRPRYKYVWSWKQDGSEGLVYGGDKIHARQGYRWKHPVHEVLTSSDEVQTWIDLEIHHHADNTKSRGQYLLLLELAVTEDPDDDRNAHYFARELMFNNQNDRAVVEFKRHLELPKATWKPERAASMRYLGKISQTDNESWFLKAAAEAPEYREPWVDLANYYYSIENWIACYAAAKRALSIEVKRLEYLCEGSAWGSLPHDLVAISAWNLGLMKEAQTHGEIAASLDSSDLRLQRNLEYYKTTRNKDAILL